jgi:hypothetical protein
VDWVHLAQDTDQEWDCLTMVIDHLLWASVGGKESNVTWMLEGGTERFLVLLRDRTSDLGAWPNKKKKENIFKQADNLGEGDFKIRPPYCRLGFYSGTVTHLGQNV